MKVFAKSYNKEDIGMLVGPSSWVYSYTPLSTPDLNFIYVLLYVICGKDGMSGE